MNIGTFLFEIQRSLIHEQTLEFRDFPASIQKGWRKEVDYSVVKCMDFPVYPDPEANYYTKGWPLGYMQHVCRKLDMRVTEVLYAPRFLFSLNYLSLLKILEENCFSLTKIHEGHRAGPTGEYRVATIEFVVESGDVPKVVSFMM